MTHNLQAGSRAPANWMLRGLIPLLALAVLGALGGSASAQVIEIRKPDGSRYEDARIRDLETDIRRWHAKGQSLDASWAKLRAFGRKVDEAKPQRPLNRRPEPEQIRAYERARARYSNMVAQYNSYLRGLRQDTAAWEQERRRLRARYDQIANSDR